MHERRIGERRQVYEPDAVLIGAPQPLCGRDRDGCLADPAWPDNREETLILQPAREIRDQLGSTDQARHSGRQVVGIRSGERRI